MLQRKTIGTLLQVFSLLLLLSGTGVAGMCQTLRDRPNIIIFLSDDHGAEDARCFGNEDLRTPVMDQMAREGMVFTKAFTPVSVCAPSRSALYTGLYPHRNGCHRNHGQIKAGVITLPVYLKALGYKVALAGKKHIKPEEAFDFIYMARHEVPEFLQNIGEDPFCLIIAFNAPHQPYFNHKGGYGKVEGKSWLPQTPESARYIAAYYDHVTLLDHEIGASLYWIEKYGFGDALQLYTSDHGAAFPFAKWTLYNQGIRVPFILKWRGKIPPGTRKQAMVSLVDILPTLVEVAGGQVPDSLDGQSMVPLWSGERANIHQYKYAAYTNVGTAGANEYPIRAIRDSTFKLIVNLRHENKFQIKRMDTPDARARIDSYRVLKSWMKIQEGDSASWQRAKQHRHRPETELYDLEADPYERHNLAEAPEYFQVKERLFRELSRWMDRQNDPLSEEIKDLYKAGRTN